MMTQEELIKEIKELPANRKREILDLITRDLRERTQPPEDRSSVGSSGTARGSISQRLYGILKFDGGPPTDDEVKDMIADYLLEKYS